MFPGQLTLCLNARDLVGMRRFYEALGMQTHIEQPNFVLLNNGDVDIALMTFLETPCLNFRGADILRLHEQAAASGLVLEDQPQRYKKEQADAEADGTNWIKLDPDGNNIFFDTNENEMGEKGYFLALQRVLDATAKQLINVGAPQQCQETFHTGVLERFMPLERRAQTDRGLDTSPLTEPGEYAGDFTLCLSTTDNVKACRFYEAIGLEVTGNNDEKWAQMGNGDCRIDLMTFLDENWLNFRGSDIFRIHARLHDRLQMSSPGFELEGEPTRYTSEEMGGGAPGTHWQTRDPDGNLVYFDTTDPELMIPGDPKTLERVLRRTLRQLQNIGVDQDCMKAFQTEVMNRFIA